jgi:alkane 1-monooxygenase
MLAGIWSVAASDIFAIGSTLSQLFNYDFNLAKADTLWWQHCIGLLYVGLMVSMIGIVVAHELVHRTTDKTSVCIGRWLLAFSFDSNFSIEHVFGHHRYVATPADPATAPRGRNVYQHIILSTYEGNISAWKIEKTRLQRRQKPLLSLHNSFIRGLSMSLLLLLSAYIMAGWIAVLYCSLVALFSKTLLEIVNYMEHYGLVREKNKPVAPRHSWNTNKKISSWSMFNLSRHSHHHAKGHIPFHQLKPYEEAPMMLNGYLGTICVTLIPPLWFKLMKPKLQHWDQVYATEKERELLDNC